MHPSDLSHLRGEKRRRVWYRLHSSGQMEDIYSMTSSNELDRFFASYNKHLKIQAIILNILSPFVDKYREVMLLS